MGEKPDTSNQCQIWANRWCATVRKNLFTFLPSCLWKFLHRADISGAVGICCCATSAVPCAEHVNKETNVCRVLILNSVRASTQERPHRNRFKAAPDALTRERSIPSAQNHLKIWPLFPIYMTSAANITSLPSPNDAFCFSDLCFSLWCSFAV